jgi:hypothetical protein
MSRVGNIKKNKLKNDSFFKGWLSFCWIRIGTQDTPVRILDRIWLYRHEKEFILSLWSIFSFSGSEKKSLSAVLLCT